jgi:formylglycine-generating enzyme required for sulfatase activity
MGSFAILMMILFPYFKNDRKKREEEKQGCVLMCAWPTRVQDYEQFMKETEPQKDPKRQYKEAEYFWQNPGFEQQPTFPVVVVTWDDAQAFCQWLTKKERASKTIPADAEYRLPTVAEWRLAEGATAYPWGEAWPPPAKTGNFGGEEFSRGRGYSGAGKDMKGYEDAHELASPVGSYPPNRDGLFDVAGNVQTWTQDWYRKEMITDPEKAADDGGGQKFRVISGSAWDSNVKWEFLSNRIRPAYPGFHSQTVGFRCVLVLKPPAKP